jgi:L-alanine-DL-glutamate epimerase-like enolase superfamily enzyme
MLQVQYQTHQLPFRYPFTTAKGTKTHQATLILSLGWRNFTGYGEATSIPYYQADIAEMASILDEKRTSIARYALNGPERFWHFLHHLIPNHPFLIAALDMAGWDIWAQLMRKPLYNMIGLQWKNIPVTSYTIGISSIDDVPLIVEQNPAPIYKLKVGTEHDLATLAILRKHTDAIIRIDANEGWDLNWAMEILPYLEQYNVELIEQPFHRKDIDALVAFKSHTSIPIIADEACTSPAEAEDCLKYYDGINIKLSKCAGITPAISMLKIAKSLKKKVMLGNMCETVVGSTLLAHLLPLADYADIDGPLLLKENIGEGLVFNNYTISLPNLPGSGVSIKN